MNTNAVFTHTLRIERQVESVSIPAGTKCRFTRESFIGGWGNQVSNKQAITIYYEDGSLEDGDITDREKKECFAEL